MTVKPKSNLYVGPGNIFPNLWHCICKYHGIYRASIYGYMNSSTCLSALHARKKHHTNCEQNDRHDVTDYIQINLTTSCSVFPNLTHCKNISKLTRRVWHETVCWMHYKKCQSNDQFLCNMQSTFKQTNALRLTYWGRDKMSDIIQTTFSDTFSWLKMFEFQIQFHLSLFLRVQLTTKQHRFR